MELPWLVLLTTESICKVRIFFGVLIDNNLHLGIHGRHTESCCLNPCWDHWTAPVTELQIRRENKFGEEIAGHQSKLNIPGFILFLFSNKLSKKGLVLSSHEKRPVYNACMVITNWLQSQKSLKVFNLYLSMKIVIASLFAYHETPG